MEEMLQVDVTPDIGDEGSNQEQECERADGAPLMPSRRDPLAAQEKERNEPQEHQKDHEDQKGREDVVPERQREPAAGVGP